MKNDVEEAGIEGFQPENYPTNETNLPTLLRSTRNLQPALPAPLPALQDISAINIQRPMADQMRFGSSASILCLKS